MIQTLIEENKGNGTASTQSSQIFGQKTSTNTSGEVKRTYVNDCNERKDRTPARQLNAYSKLKYFGNAEIPKQERRTDERNDELERPLIEPDTVALNRS